MSDPGSTDEVRTTWESVAPAWERNRQRVFDGFRPVSQWLVDQVDPLGGQTLLELAAGPGETGFLAVERLGPSGHLISSDLSPAMVEAAQRGAAARGLDNVECRVIDAQEIDLPDSSVDGVISRLGFMLTPDPGQVFREVRRVLRRGGRLAYAVIGAPDRNQWISVMMMSLVSHGHLPPGGDPFGPGGPFSLSAPDRNRELLAAAGFTDVRVEELAGAMPFDDPADYWDFLSSVGGSAPAMLAKLSAAEVDEVRSSVEAALSGFQTGDRYELPSHLVAVAAT